MDLADLQTHLVHQRLYLRGRWSDDKLKFDASGHLIGSSNLLPFTLSGVDLDSAKIGPEGLALKGHRIGLVFHGDTIAGVPELESIHIVIQPTPNGDYHAALDSIFTADLATFVPTLPTYWQQYGKEHLLHAAATSTKGISPTSTQSGSGDVHSTNEIPVRHIGPGIRPPRVLKAPDPSFTLQARNRAINGDVLVYLVVDTQGKPTNVRILKPLGFGLDELAVDAVSQYKFEPAERNGVPVPAEMKVEVNFQSY